MTDRIKQSVNSLRPFIKDKNFSIDEIMRMIEIVVNQNCNEQENDATSIVRRLSEWSRKYPRDRVYGMSRQPQMDNELIEIEEMAKEFITSLKR